MRFTTHTALSKCKLRYVVIATIVAFCFGPVATGRSEPAFDPILKDLSDQNALVLQANWPEEGGASGFEARLFGRGATSGDLKLRFRRTVSEQILLDGQEIPEEQGLFWTDEPLERTVTPRNDSAGGALWEWRGVIVAPRRFAPAQEAALLIELVDAQGNSQWIRSFLGDSWLVAGSQNTGRTLPDGIDEVPGFRIALEADDKSTPTILTYLPQPQAPVDWPKGAPQLGARFAAALGQNMKRPQMVVTVTKPRRGTDYWQNLKFEELAPLNGWRGEYRLGLGIRGVIWWAGEDAAETNPPPERLPAETATASLAARRAPLVQWQKDQRHGLSGAMMRVAHLLAFGSDQPSTPTPGDPSVGRLTFLVVQAQGVWRQPPHFDGFQFQPGPDSSWELLRAAQNDVVAAWRTDAMRLPVPERVGYRAFLVPALAETEKPTDPFFQARWQWDREDDKARYQALAERLAATAQRALAWRKALAAPNVAEVSWTDSKSAVVNIPGAAKLSPALTNGSKLEYLSVSENSSAWKAVPESTPWTFPLRVTAGPGETVIAVRYGAGDNPGPLRSIESNGKPVCLLPTFEFHREVFAQ